MTEDGLPPEGIELVDPTWDAWQPPEVAERLAGVAIPWYVAAGWALDLFRGNAFTNRRSIQVAGDRVIVEHTWGGKAAADVPGWAAEGERVALDVATFLTVRDGLLVEYHDYG